MLGISFPSDRYDFVKEAELLTTDCHVLNDRDEAMRQTRKLQAEIIAEREKVDALMK